MSNGILVHRLGGSTSNNRLQPDAFTILKANTIYVNETGDQMRGDLNMNQNKIINVSSESDIITKEALNVNNINLREDITKTINENNTKLKQLIIITVNENIE